MCGVRMYQLVWTAERKLSASDVRKIVKPTRATVVQFRVRLGEQVLFDASDDEMAKSIAKTVTPLPLESETLQTDSNFFSLLVELYEGNFFSAHSTENEWSGALAGVVTKTSPLRMIGRVNNKPACETRSFLFLVDTKTTPPVSENGAHVCF